MLLLAMSIGSCGHKDEVLEDGREILSEAVSSHTEGESAEDILEKEPEESSSATIEKETDGLEELQWKETPWEMQPGDRTMENLLATALAPIGQTMYVWGGGWNEEDSGAGPEATSLGVSPKWAEFSEKQTSEYDYHDYKYQIHDGLDCSGYIGWLVYNLFETESGQEGYVMKSSHMAKNFADRGWGTFTPAEQVTDWQLGDIMSMDGHVWLSLGMCEDGSVLILHSSVTGVSVCGTLLPDGSESQAVLLAMKFMQTCYPEWYEKYSKCSRSHDYLTESGQFRWDEEILKDEKGLKAYLAEDLLGLLEKKFLAN